MIRMSIFSKCSYKLYKRAWYTFFKLLFTMSLSKKYILLFSLAHVHTRTHAHTQAHALFIVSKSFDAGIFLILPESVNRSFSHNYVTTATWLTIIKCITILRILKCGKCLGFRIYKTGHVYLRLKWSFMENCLYFYVMHPDIFFFCSISLKSYWSRLINGLRNQLENTRWIDWFVLNAIWKDRGPSRSHHWIFLDLNSAILRS